MRAFLIKFIHLINQIIDAIAVLSFLGTFLLVIINVVGRYVTYLGSLSWSEEGARYLFISTCCFGLIQVTRKREHFAITMMTDALPPICRKACALLVDALMIALSTVLLHGSLLMASFTRNNRSPAIGLPSCVLYYLEAFAAFGMLVYLAKNTAEDLSGRKFLAAGEAEEMR